MCHVPLTCLGSVYALLNIDMMKEIAFSVCSEDIISINKLASMKKRSISTPYNLITRKI